MIYLELFFSLVWKQIRFSGHLISWPGILLCQLLVQLCSGKLSESFWTKPPMDFEVLSFFSAAQTMAKVMKYLEPQLTHKCGQCPCKCTI